MRRPDLPFSKAITKRSALYIAYHKRLLYLAKDKRRMNNQAGKEIYSKVDVWSSLIYPNPFHLLLVYISLNWRTFNKCVMLFLYFNFTDLCCWNKVRHQEEWKSISPLEHSKGV